MRETATIGAIELARSNDARCILPNETEVVTRASSSQRRKVWNVLRYGFGWMDGWMDGGGCEEQAALCDIDGLSRWPKLTCICWDLHEMVTRCHSCV